MNGTKGIGQVGIALLALLLSACVTDGGTGPLEPLARVLEDTAAGLRGGEPAAERSLADDPARGLERLPPASEPLASGSQLALVIGNADYEFAPLANPINDARAMAAVLEAKGFEVMLRTDLSYAAMEQALRSFGQRLQRRKGVGLVYFAGHGVQVDGENYLIPVNNDRIRDALAVKDYALALNQIDRRLGAAGNAFNMIILDACRDDPFRGATTRSLSRGLSEPPSARGRLIGFATAPRDVAADAPGAANSPYTAALVETIRQPGLEVEDVFKRVYQKVAQSTNGRQRPWFNASFTGRYCFGGCSDGSPAATAALATAPAPAAPAPAAPDPAIERQRQETERLAAEVERERRERERL